MSRFTVPGPPVPWARPRFVGKRAFTKPEAKEHIECVRYYANEHCPVRLTNGVYLECSFYLPTRRRVDIDNLVKAVADAMLPFGGWPGVYADDSQITTLVARKYFDKENPRTVVIVREDTLRLVDDDSDEADDGSRNRGYP